MANSSVLLLPQMRGPIPFCTSMLALEAWHCSSAQIRYRASLGFASLILESLCPLQYGHESNTVVQFVLFPQFDQCDELGFDVNSHLQQSLAIHRLNHCVQPVFSYCFPWKWSTHSLGLYASLRGQMHSHPLGYTTTTESIELVSHLHDIGVFNCLQEEGATTIFWFWFANCIPWIRRQHHICHHKVRKLMLSNTHQIWEIYINFIISKIRTKCK